MRLVVPGDDVRAAIDCSTCTEAPGSGHCWSFLGRNNELLRCLSDEFIADAHDRLNKTLDVFDLAAKVDEAGTKSKVPVHYRATGKKLGFLNEAPQDVGIEIVEVADAIVYVAKATDGERRFSE